MINPPSCCHSSVTPNDLDSASLKHWSCRQDHGKYEELQKVNRLGTVGGEERQLAVVFPLSLLPLTELTRGKHPFPGKTLAASLPQADSFHTSKSFWRERVELHESKQLLSALQ